MKKAHKRMNAIVRPSLIFSLKLYPQIEPTGTIETIETIGTTFAPNKRLERSEAVERLERFERSFFTSGTIGTVRLSSDVELLNGLNV